MTLAGIIGVSLLRAELPALSDREWLGYFVGFETKNYRFGISSHGEATIKMLGKSGEPLAQKLTIPIQFLVEEVMPSGKVVAKSVIIESLESAQVATNKPKDIVIQGRVTGDAKFEVTVNEDRGVVSLGGRLLDPGTLKNPLRFSLRLKFGEAYPSEKTVRDRREQKEFEDKTRGDSLQLTWTDGKRVKQATTKSIDAGSAEVNGPGIAAAQIEFSSYQGNKFLATASASASMKLSNSPAGALQDGFMLTWTADPAKDPQGKARLTIDVK